MNYLVFWTEFQMSGVDREICEAEKPQFFTVDKLCRPLSHTASQCPTRHLEVVHGITLMPLVPYIVLCVTTVTRVTNVTGVTNVPNVTKVTKVTQSHRSHKSHRCHKSHQKSWKVTEVTKGRCQTLRNMI